MFNLVLCLFQLVHLDDDVVDLLKVEDGQLYYASGGIERDRRVVTEILTLNLDDFTTTSLVKVPTYERDSVLRSGSFNVAVTEGKAVLTDSVETVVASDARLVTTRDGRIAKYWPDTGCLRLDFADLEFTVDQIPFALGANFVASRTLQETRVFQTCDGVCWFEITVPSSISVPLLGTGLAWKTDDALFSVDSFAPLRVVRQEATLFSVDSFAPLRVVRQEAPGILIGHSTSGDQLLLFDPESRSVIIFSKDDKIHERYVLPLFLPSGSQIVFIEQGVLLSGRDVLLLRDVTGTFFAWSETTWRQQKE